MFVVFLGRMPCRKILICPIDVFIEGGKYLVINSVVSPGHVKKNPFRMALMKVDVVEKPEIACNFMASSFRVFFNV